MGTVLDTGAAEACPCGGCAARRERAAASDGTPCPSCGRDALRTGKSVAGRCEGCAWVAYSLAVGIANDNAARVLS